MMRERESAARRLPWWWNASLIALGFAMALFRLIPTEADPDLWGHLRFGLDTIGSGQIVRPDIYSYLSGLPGASSGGYPWINHEWLAEVIMATAWNGYGAGGLVAVKVAIGLGIATIVCRHLIARGVTLLGALLMTAYGMAVILPGLRSFRPQAFTYIAFALLLVWIHRASRGHLKAMLGAPPLMAAWANLHGGFVAGLGLIAIWLVTDAFRLRGRGPGPGHTTAPARERPRAFAVIACALAAASIAATALSPYGWTLWTFLARTLGPRPEIAEWQGVSLVTVQGLAYLVVAGAGVTALFMTRQPRPAIDILLIVCAVILPFIAQRHLPLTVLIVLVIGGEHIASAAPIVVRRLTTRRSTAPERAANTRPDASAHARTPEELARLASAADKAAPPSEPPPSEPPPSERPPSTLPPQSLSSRTQKPMSSRLPAARPSDRFRPLVGAALLVETGVLIALIASSPRAGRIVYTSAEYPVEITARLADFAAAGGRANVAVHFNWGEYVLWHAGPRVKVSVDGRRETVYSDAAYHDNMQFLDGVDEWDRLLTRQPGRPQQETDLTLVPAGTAVYHLMLAQPDWELVMERGPAALFGRRGSEVTSHLHAIPVRALDGDTTLIFP